MKIRHTAASMALVLATSAFWSVAAPAAPGIAATDHAPTLVKTIRDNTGRFHNVETAKDEGYGLFLGCVSGDEDGAMGVHFVNGDLVDDPALDPTRPEAVIYEQVGGQLRLIAAEFVVLADAWNANNATPPVLMGQSFHFTDAPNRYGLPAFYDLHVWAWKDNPEGMFAEFNPSVSCEQYTGD